MEKCQCLRLLCPDAAEYLVYLYVSVVLTSTKGNPDQSAKIWQLL